MGQRYDPLAGNETEMGRNSKNRYNQFVNKERLEMAKLVVASAQVKLPKLMLSWTGPYRVTRQLMIRLMGLNTW
jgi:hypothetical protein